MRWNVCDIIDEAKTTTTTVAREELSKCEANGGEGVLYFWNDLLPRKSVDNDKNAFIYFFLQKGLFVIMLMKNCIHGIPLLLYVVLP